MGYALYLQGDLVQATVPTQEGLALARELGDKLFIFQTLETLGSIALSQGDLEQAITYFTEGLSVAQELGNETHIKEGLSLELSRDMLITWHLIGLARVAIVQKQLMRAARLFAAAEVRYDVNKQMSPDQRDDYKRTVGSLRAQLGEQAFKAAWAEGLIMTIEQILAEPEPVRMFESDPMMNTLPAIDKSPATPNHPDGLSVRELEVLRLLATGLTDAQIAEQLVLSLHTIHAHLRTIYSKLGVTSRSAATRYAFEHQLV